MNPFNNTDKRSAPCAEWQCLHANFTILVDLVISNTQQLSITIAIINFILKSRSSHQVPKNIHDLD